MVAFYQHVAQPDTDKSADTRTLPRAMRRDMGINQRPNAHILYNPEEKGQAIDLFVGDGEMWCHTRILPHHT